MATSTPGFPLKRGGPRFVNTLVTFEDEKPVDFTRILPPELILQSLLYLRHEDDVLSIRATCWTLRRIALLHELLLMPLSFNPGWPTKEAMTAYRNGDMEAAAVCDWSSPLKYLRSTEFHHHITTLNFKVPGTDTVHMAPEMWDATLWPQLQSLEIRWDSDCELSCIPAMPKNLKRLKIIGPADYAWTLADYAAALCPGLESLALFISLGTENGYEGLTYIAERCGATLASLHLSHGKLSSACDKIGLDVLAPLGSRELFPALKNVSFDLQIWGVTGGPTLKEGNSNPGVFNDGNQRVAFFIRLYRAWNSHRGWRYSAAGELVESAFNFENEAQALHINEILCCLHYDRGLETVSLRDVRGWLQWMVQETDWNRELRVGPANDLNPPWQPWPLVFSSLAAPDDGFLNVIAEHLKVLKLIATTNLMLQVGFRRNEDSDRQLRKHKQVMANLQHLIINPNDAFNQIYYKPNDFHRHAQDFTNKLESLPLDRPALRSLEFRCASDWTLPIHFTPGLITALTHLTQLTHLTLDLGLFLQPQRPSGHMRRAFTHRDPTCTYLTSASSDWDIRDPSDRTQPRYIMQRLHTLIVALSGTALKSLTLSQLLILRDADATTLFSIPTLLPALDSLTIDGLIWHLDFETQRNTCSTCAALDPGHGLKHSCFADWPHAFHGVCKEPGDERFWDSIGSATRARRDNPPTGPPWINAEDAEVYDYDDIRGMQRGLTSRWYRNERLRGWVERVLRGEGKGSLEVAVKKVGLDARGVSPAVVKRYVDTELLGQEDEVGTTVPRYMRGLKREEPYIRGSEDVEVGIWSEHVDQPILGPVGDRGADAGR